MQHDSSNMGDITEKIDKTTGALNGGLTSLPLNMATDVITRWQGALGGSDNLEIQSIAGDLGQLKEQLSGGDLNAGTVGQLLSGLGEKVSMVAASQSGMVSTSLTQLGMALSSAGSQLLS